jgi:hypothetical protein
MLSSASTTPLGVLPMRTGSLKETWLKLPLGTFVSTTTAFGSKKEKLRRRLHGVI